MLDHKFKSEVTARRLEVITETGRRRWFSKDDKVRIVEETLVTGAVVSEVARRHGLTPQQVFTWRRQARRLPTPMAGLCNCRNAAVIEHTADDDVGVWTSGL